MYAKDTSWKDEWHGKSADDTHRRTADDTHR